MYTISKNTILKERGEAYFQKYFKINHFRTSDGDVIEAERRMKSSTSNETTEINSQAIYFNATNNTANTRLPDGG